MSREFNRYYRLRFPKNSSNLRKQYADAIIQSGKAVRVDVMDLPRGINMMC